MSKIFDSVIIYGSGTTNSSTLETLNGNKINTFTIKDNGNVGIGTSSPTSKLDIDLGSTSGIDVAFQTRGAIPFLVNNRTFFSVNNNGRLTAGNIGGSSNLGHTFAAPIGSSNALKVTSDGSYQGLFSINTDGSFDIGNSVIAGSYFDSNGTNIFRFYGSNGGQSQKIGINEITPTATVHIKGSDSLSTNYGLKVQNSGGTDNLVVRNDGNVGLGTTNPTHLLDLKHTPPSSAWTSFNSIRIMTDTNITPVQLVTNSKGGASLSLGATNSSSNDGGNIIINGTNPSITLNGNSASYYTSMVLKSGAYGLGAGFGETYFTNYGGFGIETYDGFGVKTSNDGNRNNSKYALNIDGNQYVGIGTAQAGGVSSSGRLTVQGITTDTNTFKVSRPTTGLGTVSASQGVGSYSAYTRFDGIGTTFTRCLNVGESIISSGFTLAVQEIVSDTVLYSTLNTGATFTNQSYTLQGLTSINTTNLGNVGIGTSTPSEKLEVNGKTKTTTLQVTSGATSGYVLTATDSNGNMSWQEPQDLTKLGTGLTVHFSGKTIFNLPSSPISGNISGDTANAKLGMIQKIYHQSSVEPTFPTTWKLVGEGVYFTNELNIIYAEYVEPTWIEYWIIQQQ